MDEHHATTWTTAAVEDIAAPETRSIAIGPFGSALKAEEYSTHGIPVVRGQDIRDGNKLAEAGLVYVPKDVAAKFPACIVREGDLVFPHRGAIGRVGIVDDREFLLSSSMMKLTCNRQLVHPRFVFYYFRGPGQAELLSRASTVGTPGIGQPLKSLKGIPIRFPKLSQQQAIAEVLGALDNKIAANDRIANTARNLADSLFIASFQQDPATRITMGELADRGILALGDGYRTKRAEHGRPGFRILRAGDVQGGRIIPEGADFVSDVYIRQIGRRVSQPGDVILTTKGSVGRVAVVPPGLEAVVYSPQICYFRVLDEEALDGDYLAAWFRSPDLQNQASKMMFKSDMAPYINLRDIRSLTVPVPNRTEQRTQGELQRSLLGIFHGAHSENRRLGRTRDELLPLLMSGKVRVREAKKIVEGVV